MTVSEASVKRSVLGAARGVSGNSFKRPDWFPVYSHSCPGARWSRLKHGPAEAAAVPVGTALRIHSNVFTFIEFH